MPVSQRGASGRVVCRESSSKGRPAFPVRVSPARRSNILVRRGLVSAADSAAFDLPGEVLTGRGHGHPRLMPNPRTGSRSRPSTAHAESTNWFPVTENRTDRILRLSMPSIAG
jgi:hypothetical protein